MGSMVSSRAKPQIPRLVRLTLLGIANKAERLVNEVFGKVIAFLGLIGLLDKCIVLSKIGIPNRPSPSSPGTCGFVRALTMLRITLPRTT